MTSSYTVPENSNGMHVSEYILGHDKHENELQSIADLPKFLRWGVHLAPTRWKKTYMAIIVFREIGFSIPIFSYITSSLAVGIIFAALAILFFAVDTLQPDFTKGVFLDMLLKDAKVTNKINNNIVNATIGGFIFIPFFILYLNLFQILPEEKAMTDLFKDEFLEYKDSIRRWI